MKMQDPQPQLPPKGDCPEEREVERGNGGKGRMEGEGIRDGCNSSTGFSSCSSEPAAECPPADTDDNQECPMSQSQATFQGDPVMMLSGQECV